MSEIETLLKEIQIDEIEMKLKRDEEGKIEDEIKLPNYIFYDVVKKHISKFRYKIQELVSLYKSYLEEKTNEIKTKLVSLIESIFNYSEEKTLRDIEFNGLNNQVVLDNIEDEDLKLKLKFFDYLDLNDKLLYEFALKESGVQNEKYNDDLYSLMLNYYYMKYYYHDFIYEKHIFNELFLQSYPEFSKYFTPEYQLDLEVKRELKKLKQEENIVKIKKRDTNINGEIIDNTTLKYTIDGVIINICDIKVNKENKKAKFKLIYGSNYTFDCYYNNDDILIQTSSLYENKSGTYLLVFNYHIYNDRYTEILYYDFDNKIKNSGYNIDSYNYLATLQFSSDKTRILNPIIKEGPGVDTHDYMKIEYNIGRLDQLDTFTLNINNPSINSTMEYNKFEFKLSNNIGISIDTNYLKINNFDIFNRYSYEFCNIDSNIPNSDIVPDLPPLIPTNPTVIKRKSKLIKYTNMHSQNLLGLYKLF